MGRSHQATLVGAVTALLVSSPLSAQVPDGTYSFVIFGESPVDTVAVGRFAVSRVGFDLGAWPEPLLERVLRRSLWLMPDHASAPTVCFGFSSSRRAVGGREFYPGIIPHGLSVATFVADTMKIPVFQSIDAGAYLAARDEAGEVRGLLHQSDSDDETSAPLEWLPFRAQRVGEADDRSCEETVR